MRNEDFIKKLSDENVQLRAENTKSAEQLLAIASEMAKLSLNVPEK